jgi:hypothetical protein
MLTQGKKAVVDDSDFEWLNQWKWRFHHGYASRTSKNIMMHRVLNDTPEGFDTDHINRDKLDNRRCNLRTTTRSHNNLNAPAQSNSKSGVRGVWFSHQWDRWYAQIKVDGKRLCLGSSKSKEAAIKLRRDAESELIPV